MSGGETAGRPETRRGSDSRLGARGSVEPPRVDAGAHLRRLAGKPADEVLSRISNGDPLELYPLCVQRIRETYFTVDPDRVFERALAFVAVGIEVEKDCDTAGWLLGRVDRAIQRVLDRDREEERTGIPAENPEEHFRLFVEGFYREPALARLASVRLNDLEERVRKGFHHLLIEGRSVDECLEMGLGPPERLQRDILIALQAIGLIDDAGFKELGAEEPQP
jgi:hypothetical protein